MANRTGRGGFKKGKSGNPGGWPRQLASVMSRWTSSAIASSSNVVGPSNYFETRVEAAAKAPWRCRADPMHRNSRLRGSRMGDLAARIRRRQAV